MTPPPQTQNSPSRLTIIPWDPESEEHLERLRRQRKACGWNEGAVGGWRGLQREGKMGIHWLVLKHTTPPSPPSGASGPSEPSSLPLLIDTATTIFASPRAPTNSLFQSIGHISLDSYSQKQELGLSAVEGVYSITTFYIERELRGGGLGGEAMGIMEGYARDTLKAKAIALDTISNSESDETLPRRIALGVPPPKFSNEDWYTRRGYKAYTTRDNCYIDTDSEGRVWGATAVFMRKDF